MTKRIVSLTLSLIMVLSLFTGLSFPVGAEEEAAGTYVKVTEEDVSALETGDKVFLASKIGDFFYELDLSQGVPLVGENSALGELEFEITVLPDSIGYCFTYTIDEVQQYLQWSEASGITLEPLDGENAISTSAQWNINTDSMTLSPKEAPNKVLALNSNRFMCVDPSASTNFVQLYKLDTTGGSGEEDSSEDLSPSYEIYFVDQTGAADPSFELSDSETPVDTPDDLVVNPTALNVAVSNTEGDTDHANLVNMGQAYVDGVGLKDYYVAEVAADVAESQGYIAFVDGDGKKTAFVDYKTYATYYEGRNVYYTIYYIAKNGDVLTATQGTDVWPAPGETTVSCTEATAVTYTGLFTSGTLTETVTAGTLEHVWGEWETDPELPGQQIRTCARCDETETKLSSGYFLVGTFSGVNYWQDNIKPENYFTKNPENEDEWMLSTILVKNDEFKVIYYNNETGAVTWYPDGSPNYILGENQAGGVTVYFRPDGQGGDGWHYGYIYIVKNITPSNVATTSVNFQGKIALNVYLVMSDEIKADSGAYVNVTFNGVTTKRLVSELPVDNKGRSVVVQETLAGYMRFPVKLQIFNGSDEVQPLTYKQTTDVTDGFEYAVIDYLKGIQAVSTDSKTIELVRAAELYGIAVQKNFNFHTDQLTPEDIAAVDDAAAAIAIPASCEEQVTGNLPAGISRRTKTLMFESDNALRQYFYFSDSDLDNYTFQINGAVVTPTRMTSGRYYIEQPNIASGQLSTVYTFSVSDGTDTYTIQSSALGYAYAGQGSTEDMQRLSKLLYRYSLAADAYFAH